MCACRASAAYCNHVDFSPAHSPLPAAWETHSLSTSLLYSPCGSGSCSLLTYVNTSFLFCSFLFSPCSQTADIHCAIRFLPQACSSLPLSASLWNSLTVFHFAALSLPPRTQTLLQHLGLSMNQWPKLVNLISKFSGIVNCYCHKWSPKSYT